MFYRVDFACDDNEEIQKQLNHLYSYQDDPITKVLHRNRINLFCHLMETLIRTKAIESFDSALDVGCNAGIYSKILSDMGFRHVTGIDIDPEGIRKAEECFAFQRGDSVLEYKVLSAENIDRERKYDFILATEVIEHTGNPAAVMENIRKVLAPKGVAVVTLPNKISLPYLLPFLYSLFFRDDDLDRHLSYPFYRSIGLFREDGLRIIATRGSNLFLTKGLLRLLYPGPLFEPVNRANFRLAKTWPLRYFSQFFFMAVKKEEPGDLAR